MHILTTITKLLLIGSHLPVTSCNEACDEQVCLRRDVQIFRLLDDRLAEILRLYSVYHYALMRKGMERNGEFRLSKRYKHD